MNFDIDEYWMKNALSLAKLAELKGEVPVGAILVLHNKEIARGSNSSIIKNDPTAHAEIIALRKGGKVINNYRLLNTTLYVTLEPCLMCLGAILNSRISKLVYGASDLNNSKLNLWLQIIKRNTLQIKRKVLEQECSNLIQCFFKKKESLKIKILDNIF